MAMKTVLATLEIQVGDRCVVAYKDGHFDCGAFQIRHNCNWHNATVVKAEEGGELVDIRMDNGPWANRVIQDFRADILYFPKGFCRNNM